MSQMNWTVEEAKTRLGELIENVQFGKSQTITRNGREVAILVSVDQ